MLGETRSQLTKALLRAYIWASLMPLQTKSETGATLFNRYDLGGGSWVTTGTYTGNYLGENARHSGSKDRRFSSLASAPGVKLTWGVIENDAFNAIGL